MTERAGPDDHDRKRDEDLRMSQPITRRDLLQGVELERQGNADF